MSQSQTVQESAGQTAYILRKPWQLRESVVRGDNKDDTVHNYLLGLTFHTADLFERLLRIAEHAEGAPLPKVAVHDLGARIIVRKLRNEAYMRELARRALDTVTPEQQNRAAPTTTEERARSDLDEHVLPGVTAALNSWNNMTRTISDLQPPQTATHMIQDSVKIGTIFALRGEGIAAAAIH